MSAVLAGGRDGLPRPRSAGRPPKTIAVPASRQSSTVLTGGRDGSRAPFRRAPGKKKRRPRFPALVNRACRGAMTAPAPRSAGTFKKNNRRPRVPALVNRLCGAAILPSVGVYPTDMRVFPIIQPLFVGKIP